MEEIRRSGNYVKSSWDTNYIQSLTTPYAGEEYVERVEKLKNEVKIMIEGTTDVAAQLQLIDDMQRLDVSHHFVDSIQQLLHTIYAAAAADDHHDLHLTALKFRLLRQHGYHVSQEVFTSFMDDGQNFKVASLEDDVKGLLSLYEASFLSFEGEHILDLAKHFSTPLLQKKLDQQFPGEEVDKIRHALEFPLHWRVPKLQAKWFIHMYQTGPHPNLHLLELAKLLFNIAQASYQDDIKRILRRHTRSGLSEKLRFSRDRPAECFLWALGFTPEPHFGYLREIMAKLTELVSVIDDVYDVYGTLQEIHLFTNTVQRRHTKSGLAEKLSFSRDRPAESFLFALGFTPDPELGYTREIMTKIVELISVTDDVYDVYATLEEIELFTNAIQRWDISELESLPLYMQILFLDLNNFVDEFALHVLEEKDFDCTSILRRAWIKLCQSYLIEARWYHSGYIPSMKEYLNNAWISIAIPLCLMHSYFCITNSVNKKDVHILEQDPDIFRLPAMLFRLADDFGTSSEEIKRGDVPKSIQCYMHETGCCEEDARVYVKSMIYEWWKKMNKEILMVEKPFKKFGVAAMNSARIALYFYLNNGDAYGVDPNSETKHNLISLIVDPIPIP